MTVREFSEVLRFDEVIEVYEQGKKILKIDTRYIECVKEELLGRGIEEQGVNMNKNFGIEIQLKPKEHCNE